MVTKVQIENFKSIEKLSLSLGRVNVLIGENGCGKTNILEGIAMAAAAEDVKNLEEYLGNRGVRVTPPMFMRSSFEEKKQTENINVYLKSLNKVDFDVTFRHNNQPYGVWEIINSSIDEYIKITKSGKKSIMTKLAKLGAWLAELEKKGKLTDSRDLKRFSLLKSSFEEAKIEGQDFIELLNSFAKNADLVNNFVIYAPENHFLRKTDEMGTVEPLGYRGEGLIKLLSVLHQEKPEAIEKIKEKLRLISWFEDFEIVSNGFTGSYVKIRDGYLGKDIYYPSLKSTNEGFLFLLFYLSLFIAEYTPKFFAIDNIDNALNPKLCRELVKVLAQLAKEHDKQVIFTTHNPAVLDGLNLDDDEQRLFVVYRNAEGHTKVRRVKKRETPEGYEPMRMSEQYMNGFIGGLPKNF